MAIGLGEIAPDFTLKTRSNGENRDVTLSAHRGKEHVVLLFFPGAFTPVCTAELCDVSGGIAQYTGLNAVVYGISTDSRYSLEAWAQQVGITIPLLADYAHEVTKAYDVVWPNFSGMGPSAARAVVVIDKDGVVRHTEQTPTLLDLPDLEKVKTVLAGLG